MRISAIIAAYNAADHIAETLDSLHAQKRPPDEVIICDDGSSDDTALRAESHPTSPKVLRCENGGVACARNNAIEVATGDLVANIDADDIWHEEYLQRMESALAQFPESPAAFSRYKTFLSEEGQKPWTAQDTENNDVIPMEIHEFLQFEQTGMPVLPSYYVMRSSALKRLGTRPYREEHVCGETLAVVPMLAAMGSTLCLPARLGQYRLHGGSITGSEIKTARWMVRVAEEMIERSEELGFDPNTRKEIRRYAGYWSRKSGRRLGGGGFRGEGRKAVFTGFKQGHEMKTMAILLASLVPGMGSRVWRRQWRPESAQK